jgi:hypothetical protein
MKLDSIIENQKEILVHLRHQNVGIERMCDGDLDDSLARPMNALNEVEQLCGKVEQAAFAKTLVMLKNPLFLQHIQSCRNLLCNTISFILDFSPGNI